MKEIEFDAVKVRFAELALLVQKLAAQQLELERFAREKAAHDGKSEAPPPKRFPTMPRGGFRR